MKRNEIVNKLIKEGFSEKTLVNFSDKQLANLSERMFKEEEEGEVEAGPNADPKTVAAVANAGAKVKMGETNEEKDAFIGSKKACKVCKMSPCKCGKEKKAKTNVKEELKGGQKKLDKNHNGKIDGQDFKILKGQKKEVKEDAMGLSLKSEPKKKAVDETKPSAGLSKEKKSEVVKKAKKGEDIGKKGKGFEKLADKAAKEYGSKEKGKKVAAAAMWKNTKRNGIHESDSSLNAKRNLHFELKEAGVSDNDLETKDINELADKHSSNPNVKNAHDFYKRISNKSMSMTGKNEEVKEWVMNLAENKLFHSFTSKNEIMDLIQSKLNESKK
jgi:hypothetical protein